VQPSPRESLGEAGSTGLNTLAGRPCDFEGHVVYRCHWHHP
jgi:hypothetical protein